jgi:two-component system, cell cycle response regulator
VTAVVPLVDMRVLVVDDDAVTRRILQVSVTRLGHECLLAKDGNEGWQIAEREVVDAVISDWTMPGLDGLELCRRVRMQRTSAYTYFILLTANDARQHFLAGMQAGADDYLRKPPDPDELQVRLAAASRITQLHRQLSRQNTELERLNHALFEQGRTDALTGVGNRLRMQEDLGKLWSRATRYAQPFCVALCDVDHFKLYNDSCGHQAGDRALQSVARTLAATSRGGDAVYRYGGEEFVTVLPEPGLPAAVSAMNRWREAIAALAIPHPAFHDERVVTISVGVAAFDPGTTLDELIKRADVALYVAKSRGRNRVVGFDEVPALEAQALALAKR